MEVTRVRQNTISLSLVSMVKHIIGKQIQEPTLSFCARIVA